MSGMKHLCGVYRSPLARLALLVAAALFTGCFEAVKVTVLRQVEVTGPVHQTPVRVTEGSAEGRLRLTPNVSFMPKRGVGGSVEIQQDSRISSVAQYDTMDHMRWNFPSYDLGLSFDYGLSKHFSFSGGANYAKTDGKKSYEWDLGLAWYFYGGPLGGRLEAGLQWQDVGYNALFDRYEIDYTHSNAGDVRYLYTLDRYGDFRWGNLYANLTLNTLFGRPSPNAFVRVGYGLTSVLSNEMLKVNEDGDIAASVGMLSVTPGVFLDLTGWSRIVAGCEFLSPVTMTSHSPGWLIMPVAQIDFLI